MGRDENAKGGGDAARWPFGQRDLAPITDSPWVQTVLATECAELVQAGDQVILVFTEDREEAGKTLRRVVARVAIPLANIASLAKIDALRGGTEKGPSATLMGDF